MPRAKAKKAKEGAVVISRKTWEWAKANPRYVSLLEELEDLEDIRREKALGEVSVPFGKVVEDYERLRGIRIRS